jgi:hypothetical protein
MLRDKLLIDHNVHALLSCSKPRPRRIPKALMAKNGTGVCLRLCVCVCVCVCVCFGLGLCSLCVFGQVGGCRFEACGVKTRV